MDAFVRRYQPDRWENWSKGLDREPHPEDDRARIPASALSAAALGFPLPATYSVPPSRPRTLSSASSASMLDVCASSASSAPPPAPNTSKRTSNSTDTDSQAASPDQYLCAKRARGRQHRSMVSAWASMSEPPVERSPVSAQASTDTLPISDSPLLRAAQSVLALASSTSVPFEVAAAAVLSEPPVELKPKRNSSDAGNGARRSLHRWTREELIALREAVKLYGTCWGKVCAWGLQNGRFHESRSPASCHTAFYRLSKERSGKSSLGSLNDHDFSSTSSDDEVGDEAESLTAHKRTSTQRDTSSRSSKLPSRYDPASGSINSSATTSQSTAPLVPASTDKVTSFVAASQEEPVEAPLSATSMPRTPESLQPQTLRSLASLSPNKYAYLGFSEIHSSLK